MTFLTQAPFLILPLLTFLLSLTVTMGLRRLAPALRFPGGAVGGIGLFLAWNAAMALSAPDRLFDNLPLLGASAAAVIGGAVADRWQAGRWALLAVIAAVAVLLVCPGGLMVYSLGAVTASGRDLVLGHAALPFTFLAVFVLLKSWDGLGGLKGQAEGVSISALLWIVAVTSVADTAHDQFMVFLLLGAVLGFLPALLSRGGLPLRLGHAGALFLGTCLAWIVLRLPYDAGFEIQPVIAAWIVACPVFDFFGTGLRRLARGRGLFGPGEHLHDVLCDAGYTPQRAAQLVIRLSFIYGGIGFIGQCLKVPGFYMLMGWVACAFAQLGLTSALGRKKA